MEQLDLHVKIMRFRVNIDFSLYDIDTSANTIERAVILDGISIPVSTEYAMMVWLAHQPVENVRQAIRDELGDGSTSLIHFNLLTDQKSRMIYITYFNNKPYIYSTLTHEFFHYQDCIAQECSIYAAWNDMKIFHSKKSMQTILKKVFSQDEIERITIEYCRVS